MILLSIASRQIWPQVLLVAHLKPQRLVLLHSADPIESQGPARRLKRFFDQAGLVSQGATRLEELPDADFHAVEQRLDELQLALELPLDQCCLNFTGGNKLMATAAFRWAARRGVRACYLERRNLLIWFDTREGQVHTRTESLDGHITDGLDPVALLRCQLEASEIQSPGQALALNPTGQRIDANVLFRRILNGNDARPWLSLAGAPDTAANEGDLLEYATAAALLKLGVHRVQRGLRLKAKSGHQLGTHLPHAEIDLLFTWGGRLWLVDCKDRLPTHDLLSKLARHLRGRLTTDAVELLKRIRDELAISQTKVLKQDLLAIREAGGLLGHVLCVRKAPLPDEVQHYAQLNQIRIVLKSDLINGLRAALSLPPVSARARAEGPGTSHQ